MKNTRKKVLLSSVAMLLVALVALGSATYAWFTIQKNVSADTMQVKAVAQAGLEVSIDAGKTDWDPAGLSYSAAQAKLNPVSIIPDVSATGYVPAGDVTGTGVDSGYTGTFQAVGTYEAAPASGERAAANSYFATYGVSVRSAKNGSGTRAAHSDLTAKVTSAAGEAGKDATSFVRAMLIDVTGTATKKGQWSANASESNACGGTAQADKGTPGTFTAFNNTVNLANLAADDANGQDYILVVWFEGTDAQCIDAAKGYSADLTITFGFTNAA